MPGPLQRALGTWLAPEASRGRSESLTPIYGRFTAQPFERGFATTIGNALCTESKPKPAAKKKVAKDKDAKPKKAAGVKKPAKKEGATATKKDGSQQKGASR